MFFILKRKIIKKSVKIALWVSGSLFGLLLVVYILFQTSYVQTILLRQIADQFSKELNTKIYIERVDIGFFNKLILNDVLIEDQQEDTLFFVDRLVASIDTLKLRKQKIVISSLHLEKTKAFLSLDENNLPNYKFILDSLRSSGNEGTGEWDIFCRDFIFSETQLAYSYFEMDKPKLVDLRDIHLDVSDLILGKDSIFFNVNELKLDDQKSFKLEQFNTRFLSKENEIVLDNFNLKTKKTSIKNAGFRLDQSSINEEGGMLNAGLDLRIGESSINLTDLSQFVKSLKGMDLQVDLSGRIYGTIADLKARNLQLAFGQNTNLNCNFYINGLPDIENTFISLDLKNSSTHFSDLVNVRLPNSFESEYPSFPTLLEDAGVVRYEGNFTGFLSDFVAFGTVDSNFGRLTTDLSFEPSENEDLKVEGHLKTVNFELGEFAHMKRMGALTFNGQVDGTYQRGTTSFLAAIDGVVDSLVFNDYKFRSLILDGNVADDQFAGDLSIDDPNLGAVFSGKMDFNPEFPVFDFEVFVKNADLVALNLDPINIRSDLSVDLNAKFTGNSIDNLNGNIWIEEGTYGNEYNQFNLKSLTLNTFKDSVSNLELRSDFIDADIRGQYSFINLQQSVKNLVGRFLPASGVKTIDNTSANNFSFEVQLKNLEPLTNTFVPELYVSSSQINGFYNEIDSIVDVTANFPKIDYKNMSFNNYRLHAIADDQIEIKIRLGEFVISDNQSIYNLSILADANDNNLNTRLVWNNYHEKTYSGEFEVQAVFVENQDGKLHVDADILPSKIYVSDTLWTVHPAKVIIDSTRFEVENFEITNGEQFFAFEGALSKDKMDRMNMSVNGFNLSNLNLLSKKNLDLEGVLSGSLSVFDVYEKALFLSDLKVEELNFRDKEYGDVSVVSKWDRDSESLQSELRVNNKKRQTLYAFGAYIPDSDSLDFSAQFNNFPLDVLEPFLKKNFKNIHGNATGDASIYGHPGQIRFKGDLYAENAGLSLKFTQVSYHFSDTVSFSGDSIIFDNIELRDFDGNTAAFSGSLRHDNFKNMDYNLHLSSPQILALNTTIRDNERFYGKAYADGDMRLTGHAKNIFLEVAARSLPGTNVNISLEYDEDVPVYDFIRFVNAENENIEESGRKNNYKKSELNMSFDLDVTPDAKIQLIYNSQIGDVIKSEGSGSLQIDIDPDFNIAMFGNYMVERGDYLFTLQNVINKRFGIERGGTIRWDGDPYNATIDINALYRLKASLYELFANTYDDIDYSQRIPVVCEIELTDNLNNPTIGFDIDFPTSEERIKDELRQFFNTEEDMNRQILSLLVLGRFYTPEYMRGSYEASNTNLVGTTASEMFSNYLSNWLSQISNEIDIGVNYRPGNQITNDEIELALSTQIFNDRVTLNGNIGNNATQANTANNNNIVGDFDLNVKLTNNGKLQFKAYNHSNNNLIYETSPYTQGIGFTYREQYDSFGELLAKFKRLFKKKK